MPALGHRARTAILNPVIDVRTCVPDPCQCDTMLREYFPDSRLGDCIQGQAPAHAGDGVHATKSKQFSESPCQEVVVVAVAVQQLDRFSLFPVLARFGKLLPDLVQWRVPCRKPRSGGGGVQGQVMSESDSAHSLSVRLASRGAIVLARDPCSINLSNHMALTGLETEILHTRLYTTHSHPCSFV